MSFLAADRITLSAITPRTPLSGDYGIPADKIEDVQMPIDARPSVSPNPDNAYILKPWKAQGYWWLSTLVV